MLARVLDPTTTLAGGTEIAVTVDSGMGGELTRVQLRQPDGSWLDRDERGPAV